MAGQSNGAQERRSLEGPSAVGKKERKEEEKKSKKKGKKERKKEGKKEKKERWGKPITEYIYKK